MAEEKKTGKQEVKEKAEKPKKEEKPAEKKEGKKSKEEPKSEKKTETKEKKPAGKEKKEEKKAEKPKEEKKKDKEKKVDIVSENVYTIPLGKAHRTKPCYRRTRKAIAFILEYLKRHTKSKNIKISSELNQHIWKRGATKPPHRVQIKAITDSEGKVTAALLK